MQSEFPCWLAGKDKFIAQALIETGFWYAGKAEDFIEVGTITRIEGWKIGFCYGEILLDCVRDGALFSRDIDGENPKKILKETKAAIRTCAAEWKESMDHQLELPL